MSMSNTIIQIVKLESDAEPQAVTILKMPFSAMILELKREIETHSGVPVAEQMLIFKSTPLLDFSRIKDYNVGPAATIELVVEKTDNAESLDLNITVSCLAFRLPLKVNQSEKVVALKRRIGNIFGITNTRDITLFHLTLEMKDNQPLREYDIYEGAELLMTRTGYID